MRLQEYATFSVCKQHFLENFRKKINEGKMIADHLKGPYQSQRMKGGNSRPKEVRTASAKTGMPKPVSADNGNCRFPHFRGLKVKKVVFHGRLRCNAVLHARNYCAAQMLGKPFRFGLLHPSTASPIRVQRSGTGTQNIVQRRNSKFQPVWNFHETGET